MGSASVPGIDVPIQIGQVTIQVMEAEISQTYSVHYVMKYADPPNTFYDILLDIEGVDDPIEWAAQNLQLASPSGSHELALSRPVLIGDDIRYEADFDFKHLYEFIFSVPRDTHASQVRLQLPEGKSINLGKALAAVDADRSSPPPQSYDETNSVAGGEGNIASGPFATIAGGSMNMAGASGSAICGGGMNVASAASTFIGGGQGNLALYSFATISGGYANTSRGRNSTIGGGSRNSATGRYATISGGIQNAATHSNAVICGGAYNEALEVNATVGGGTQNDAHGFSSTIGGGAGNLTSASHATIAGGLGNRAEGIYSAVGAGQRNVASGAYSTVAGGFQNRAGGDYSVASGRSAQVSDDHPGAFLFADASNAEFHSMAANEFAVRAVGGVRFVSALNNDGSPSSGVVLEPGSGSWSSLSDRASKRRIEAVDPLEILDLLVELPISTWSYASQDPKVRHMGPVAQDFFDAFELGEDERRISMVDADGVAFAAIQGMALLVQEQESLIAQHEHTIDDLQARVAALEDAQQSVERGSLQQIWDLAPALALIALLWRKNSSPAQ